MGSKKSNAKEKFKSNPSKPPKDAPRHVDVNGGATLQEDAAPPPYFRDLSPADIHQYKDLVQERAKLELEKKNLELLATKRATEVALLIRSDGELENTFTKRPGGEIKYVGNNSCCLDMSSNNTCAAGSAPKNFPCKHEICSRCKTKGISFLEMNVIKYYNVRFCAEKSERMRNALRKQRDVELARLKKSGNGQSALKACRTSAQTKALEKACEGAHQQLLYNDDGFSRKKDDLLTPGERSFTNNQPASIFSRSSRSSPHGSLDRKAQAVETAVHQNNEQITQIRASLNNIQQQLNSGGGNTDELRKELEKIHVKMDDARQNNDTFKAMLCKASTTSSQYTNIQEGLAEFMLPLVPQCANIARTMDPSPLDGLSPDELKKHVDAVASIAEFFNSCAPEQIESALEQLKMSLEASGTMSETTREAFRNLEVTMAESKAKGWKVDFKLCSSFADIGTSQPSTRTPPPTDELPPLATRLASTKIPEEFALILSEPEQQALKLMYSETERLSTESSDVLAKSLETIKMSYFQKYAFSTGPGEVLTVAMDSLIDVHKAGSMIKAIEKGMGRDEIAGHITSAVLTKAERKPEKYLEALDELFDNFTVAAGLVLPPILTDAFSQVKASMSKWFIRQRASPPQIRQQQDASILAILKAMETKKGKESKAQIEQLVCLGSGKLFDSFRDNIIQKLPEVGIGKRDYSQELDKVRSILESTEMSLPKEIECTLNRLSEDCSKWALSDAREVVEESVRQTEKSTRGGGNSYIDVRQKLAEHALDNPEDVDWLLCMLKRVSSQKGISKAGDTAKELEMLKMMAPDLKEGYLTIPALISQLYTNKYCPGVAAVHVARHVVDLTRSRARKLDGEIQILRAVVDIDRFILVNYGWFRRFKVAARIIPDFILAMSAHLKQMFSSEHEETIAANIVASLMSAAVLSPTPDQFDRIIEAIRTLIVRENVVVAADLEAIFQRLLRIAANQTLRCSGKVGDCMKHDPETQWSLSWPFAHAKSCTKLKEPLPQGPLAPQQLEPPCSRLPRYDSLAMTPKVAVQHGSVDALQRSSRTLSDIKPSDERRGVVDTANVILELAGGGQDIAKKAQNIIESQLHAFKAKGMDVPYIILDAVKKLRIVADNKTPEHNVSRGHRNGDFVLRSAVQDPICCDYEAELRTNSARKSRFTETILSSDPTSITVSKVREAHLGARKRAQEMIEGKGNLAYHLWIAKNLRRMAIEGEFEDPLEPFLRFSTFFESVGAMPSTLQLALGFESADLVEPEDGLSDPLLTDPVKEDIFSMISRVATTDNPFLPEEEWHIRKLAFEPTEVLSDCEFVWIVARVTLWQLKDNVHDFEDFLGSAVGSFDIAGVPVGDHFREAMDRLKNLANGGECTYSAAYAKDLSQMMVARWRLAAVVPNSDFLKRAREACVALKIEGGTKEGQLANWETDVDRFLSSPWAVVESHSSDRYAVTKSEDTSSCSDSVDMKSPKLTTENLNTLQRNGFIRVFQKFVMQAAHSEILNAKIPDGAEYGASMRSLAKLEMQMTTSALEAARALAEAKKWDKDAADISRALKLKDRDGGDEEEVLEESFDDEGDHSVKSNAEEDGGSESSAMWLEVSPTSARNLLAGFDMISRVRTRSTTEFQRLGSL